LAAQVVVGNKLDDIFMVMEYMEHDLKALQESMIKPFTVSEARTDFLPFLDKMLPAHCACMRRCYLATGIIPLLMGCSSGISPNY
jgi:hypothetical protein